MNHDARARLKDLLARQAYRYSPDAPFLLVSGRTSPFYFNCKAVTLTGVGFNLLGQVLADHLDQFPPVVASGGLTMGADPLALSLAAEATRRGRPLDAFCIRKEAKSHGTRKYVEGSVPSGSPVLILDDVCTTGRSTIAAIERAHGEGLSVRGALVLVDREEDDGFAAIQTALDRIGGGQVRAVYRCSEFPRETRSEA